MLCIHFCNLFWLAIVEVYQNKRKLCFSYCFLHFLQIDNLFENYLWKHGCYYESKKRLLSLNLDVMYPFLQTVYVSFSGISPSLCLTTLPHADARFLFYWCCIGAPHRVDFCSFCCILLQLGLFGCLCHLWNFAIVHLDIGQLIVFVCCLWP